MRRGRAAPPTRAHGESGSDGERGQGQRSARCQGRRVRLLGFHVRPKGSLERRARPACFRPSRIACKAHGRKGSCRGPKRAAKRARDHKAGRRKSTSALEGGTNYLQGWLNFFPHYQSLSRDPITTQRCGCFLHGDWRSKTKGQGDAECGTYTLFAPYGPIRARTYETSVGAARRAKACYVRYCTRAQ